MKMQTFLPYADFAESARCLDTKRLGKQRVEVLQILNAIQDPNRRGWQNHPCTRMWRNHVPSLIRYGVAVCDEWQRRGYRDTVRDKLLDRLTPDQESKDPPWLGDGAIHASHRSNLLRKDSVHYGKFGWTELDDLEYVWPL
jgi:hypothetical protein